MLKRILLIALLALPIAAWAFVKPVRVLAPELAGVTCIGKVCVDDIPRYPEAARLYDEAVQFVQSSVGELQSTPRIVFCATQACSRSFDSPTRGPKNFATVGVFFSHRGGHPPSSPGTHSLTI